MKKLYFLEYGSKCSKEEIKDYIESEYDFSSSEHDSSYFGVYFVYSGLYADKLTITDNYISHSQDWLDEDNKQYRTLITISIVNGKNKDKLSKYNLIKNLFNKFNQVSIISDKCVEE